MLSHLVVLPGSYTSIRACLFIIFPIKLSVFTKHGIIFCFRKHLYVILYGKACNRIFSRFLVLELVCQVCKRDLLIKIGLGICCHILADFSENVQLLTQQLPRIFHSCITDFIIWKKSRILILDIGAAFFHRINIFILDII